MRSSDPFEGLERDLNYWEVPDQTVELTVDGDDLPEDDRQLRFLVYAGLFDLLVEAAEAAWEGEQERDRRLTRVLDTIGSVEPTLRFSLHEKGRKAEGLELVSRMRGKGIVMTERWLLPRLERDMGIYTERIAALKDALGEHSR